MSSTTSAGKSPPGLSVWVTNGHGDEASICAADAAAGAHHAPDRSRDDQPSHGPERRTSRIEARSTAVIARVSSRDADDPALVGGIHGRARLPRRARGPADGRLVGLRLPVRASVAIAVVTFALLFDYTGTFLPDGLLSADGRPTAMFGIALERSSCSGWSRSAVVVFGFRDRPHATA